MTEAARSRLGADHVVGADRSRARIAIVVLAAAASLAFPVRAARSPRVDGAPFPAQRSTFRAGVDPGEYLLTVGAKAGLADGQRQVRFAIK